MKINLFYNKKVLQQTYFVNIYPMQNLLFRGGGKMLIRVDLEPER